MVFGGEDIGETGEVVLEAFQQSGVDEFVAVGSEDDLGWSVSFLDDVNGDGLDDVIVGAPGAGNGGEAYVVYGNVRSSDLTPGTMDVDKGFKITGIEGTDLFGFSVSGAGDVNGDGLGDILIGSSERSTANDAYVIFGVDGVRPAFSVSDLDGTNGFVIEGSSFPNGSIGDSVSGAGDLNGDGFDDIIIGAAGDTSVNPSSDAYIVFGRDFGNIVDQAGTDGSDTILGDLADEILIGGLGDDLIDGGAGEDILKGANGDDRLIGGADSDVFIGGNGADTFVIEATDGFQQDRINDFEQGVDVIELSGFDAMDFDLLDTNGDGVLDRADTSVQYAPIIYGAPFALKLDGFFEVLVIDDVFQLTQDDLAFV